MWKCGNVAKFGIEKGRLWDLVFLFLVYEFFLSLAWFLIHLVGGWDILVGLFHVMPSMDGLSFHFDLYIFSVQIPYNCKRLY